MLFLPVCRKSEGQKKQKVQLSADLTSTFQCRRDDVTAERIYQWTLLTALNSEKKKTNRKFERKIKKTEFSLFYVFLVNFIDIITIILV